MISGTPSLFVSSLSSERPTGIEQFVDGHTRAYTYYGSGKAALRDGLSDLVEPGENVLVPAYLPDGVVEPLIELGLEPRYYRIRSTLAPDFGDVEARIDTNTVAVLSVNYFGFPQPGLSELSDLVSEYDCYHVDDNAHAPLSVDDGTLLGTRGHLGITSLWKLFPVPDGALLYCNDDDVADRYEPSSLAGIQDGLDRTDIRFVAKSILDDVFDADGTVRQSISAIVSGRGGSPSVGTPQKRYERRKTRMSKLSYRVVEDADPIGIRRTRRENYRRWRTLLTDRDDVELVYESLPEGICPQVFPVRTDRPEAFLAELEQCGIGGVHTWPRLSSSVVEEPAYETARRLSRDVLTLPVHQHIEPSTIEAVGSELRRR
ncbi:DegT/DnrJ/EryC1/StrS aminotransferase family protein [Natrarchaeobius halalkaliphilus]|uniref:DegT/DnrJ/EryC1/StrS aminotransferase family protein n=1 Tax=Natrarchaeobius halalkaliphilus TaxID=1679091 RepID=A0A3N6LUM3_9EURY|nr:DegT/DnrJ/EryC1/StrS family aminotransferase [Natrarchaeobius halalkaliphilus]RQG91264.1 DegT/DnrJ/EryC1/StrS aminotransferase family protein [Natrarchaeobius halalkaliphilus]